MSKETIISSILVTALIIAAVFLIKKTQIRAALFAVLAAQAFSWPFSIMLVYTNAAEYPVRLFANATDNSFILSYLLFPTVFALYYLHYPRVASINRQLIFSALICGGTVLLHVLLERYTNLIKYQNFSWYWNLLTYLISFYTLRKYVEWFFNSVFSKTIC